MNTTIYNKDCRDMAELADESIHVVCTSPPYWGLRKYEGAQELIWGGNSECEHAWGKDLQRDAGFLSHQTERIELIKVNSKLFAIFDTQIDDENSAVLVNMRRKAIITQKAKQSPSKCITTRTETDTPSLINCPIAIQYAPDKIPFNSFWDFGEQTIETFLGQNTQSSELGNKGNRPNLPSPKQMIYSCPFLSNRFGWCNAIPNKFHQFLVLANEVSLPIDSDTTISNKQTYQIAKFRCPLFKEAEVYIPLLVGSPIEAAAASYRAKRIGEFGKLPSLPIDSLTAIEAIDHLASSPIWSGQSSPIHTPSICLKCGAVKAVFGLEPTPELYVQHTIEILREIKRVLRKDGVVFWNIGDSYATSSAGTGEMTSVTWEENGKPKKKSMTRIGRVAGLKPKDLCLIPFRVALAAQSAGWWVRSVIIWNKSNPMPESIHSSYFTRHYVTIEEYERLQSLRSAKGKDQDGSTDLPRMSKAEVSDCQETLSTEQEGASDSEGKGREGRCEGETPSILSFFARTTEQAEISRNIEGQANDGTPGTELQSKAIESSGGSNSRRLAGSSQQPQTPMLLLWEEKAKTHDGPRNTIEQGREAHQGKHSASLSKLQLKEIEQDGDALVACPGCSKCSPNDGYVLRKGSWRPTNSYEFILMLTKSDDYYCDADAVRELDHPDGRKQTIRRQTNRYHGELLNPFEDQEHERWTGSRNLRDVWTFPTSPFPSQFVEGEKLDHFAVFPEKLPELCIKAATPEVGCCSKCGAPWARVMERTGHINKREPAHAPKSEPTKTDSTGWAPLTKATNDWRPTCSCNADKVPATVLDPFAGAGTTLLVATKLGRKSIGYDISESYCKMTVNRNKQGAL